MIAEKTATLSCLGIAALCAGITGWSLLRGFDVPSAAQSQIEAQVGLSSAGFSAPSLQAYSPAFTRPLFDPDRRKEAPSVAGSAAAKARASGLPKMVLTGTVIDDMHRTALLERPGSAAPTPLTLNQSMNGWQLIEIAPRFVTFEKDDERRILKLRFEAPRDGAESFARAYDKTRAQPRRGAKPARLNRASLIDDMDG
ncbi:MAG: hypothetical protein AAF221_10495 [Pseudomonadota bacterium]